MGKRIHSLTFMDCERIFTMGKFLLLVGLLAVAIVMVAAGSDKASAAKPDNPGCFGTDRALFNNTWIRDLPDPGSSWWGHEAGNRAGDNGPNNQAYKAACGG
jgi:hypothetical protein